MTTFADLPKGVGWEFRVQRAAFLVGWYARRGINLRQRVAGSPQTMAEVDLIGIGFDPALSPSVLIGECKDRKGGTKEADRVIWLLGLAQVLRGADHVLFAKTTLAEATLQFAAPYRLWLWDRAAVRDIEKRFGFEEDRGFFGSFNVSLQTDVLQPSRKGAYLRNQPLRQAWDYLSGAFWYDPTPHRVKKLAGYFEALGASDGLSAQERSGFVAEGLMALLVSAYTSAGQLRRLSPARADAAQADAFASGAADAGTLRQIAARADDYYQDALIKLAAGEGDKTGARTTRVPRLAATIAETPTWMPAYVALADRLGERPQLAGDALRYSDIMLFEDALAGGEGHHVVDRVLGTDTRALQTPLELGALFLQRVWGIADPVLDNVLRMRAAGEEARKQSETVAEPEETSQEAAQTLFGDAEARGTAAPEGSS